MYILGRQLVLHTYDTADSIPVTVQKYNSMKIQGKVSRSIHVGLPRLLV